MFARLGPALALILFSPLGCLCGGPAAPLTVVTTSADKASAEQFFEFTPVEGLAFVESDKPADVVDDADGFRVALVSGIPDCEPCEPGSYRLEGSDGRYIVRSNDVLGAHYGLAHVLEGAGFRFFHPWRTRTPETLTPPATIAGAGETHIPEMTVRGLHPHTLHPIEALFDFWVPSEKNLEGARRTVDWVVKNRGNYIQYPGLDDIMAGGQTHAAWKAHSKAIIDYAHARGVKMGVGIQLYGKSNLQLAFDLLDEEVADPKAEMTKRLKLLMDDVGWDEISLSFGEFSKADPDTFVAQVNQAYDAMQEVSPGLEVNSPIHVGNQPELRVTYQGEDIIYYFLVKFANENIVPYVHTVMFYNLFDDAGGAYFHDEFPEHRAFLLERIAQGKRVNYFPESAYWIAFDNSVPIYLPIYGRSRWFDMHEIRKAAGKPLREHTLFSSGWEWGYWQTDYATLRMNFKLPDRWETPYEEMFAPWGERGQKLSAQVTRLGNLQYDALLKQRLAPYLAGRDQLIDAGELIGIVSQPDRILFGEVHAMDESNRTLFENNVVVPLGQFAEAQAQVLAEIQALDPDSDPWFAEIRDGVEVTLARTRYIHALYRAVIADARQQNPDAIIDEALKYLADGKVPVARRHKQLHDPDPAELIRTDVPNPTYYKYGYLREANTLCFWNRERVEVLRLIKGSTESQPACVL